MTANVQAAKSRFGLAVFIQNATVIEDCEFMFLSMAPGEAEGQVVIRNNEAIANTVVLKWSNINPTDTVKFVDCTYYTLVQVSATFNPFADGTKHWAENSNVSYAPLTLLPEPAPEA